MKKYFTKAGREVKMGDSLKVITKLNTPFGEVNANYTITIDEKNAEKLIKEGFITVKEKEDPVAKLGDNKIILTYDSKKERDEAFDTFTAVEEHLSELCDEVMSRFYND